MRVMNGCVSYRELLTHKTILNAKLACTSFMHDSDMMLPLLV